MSEHLFSFTPEVDDDVPGQWRLSLVQLYNWGTINGACTITVPRKGLLITGESGSGKSTILDALSALMMPDASSQFNAAASGGTTGDSARSRLSYVRGAFAQELDEDSYETRTVFLRPKATKSGIAVTFDDGLGHQWTGLRIFHAKSGTTSNSDLTQGFFTCQGSLSLTDVMRHVDDGHFVRSVQKAFPELTTSQSSKSFHGVLIRKIGIGSEVAAALLHKTLATKNVSSLNRLMREYMLDEPKTFKSAETAVEQFQNLKSAHDDVVKARQQIELLSPLRDYQERRQNAQDKLRRATELEAMLDAYGAMLKRDQAVKDEEAYGVEKEQLQDQERNVEAEIQFLEKDLESVNSAFVRAGGAAVESIKHQLDHCQEALDRVREARQSFASFIVDLPSVALPSTSQEFQALLTHARKEVASIQDAVEGYDSERITQEITANTLGVEIANLKRELSSLKERENALPSSLVDVRSRMAQELGVPEYRLPFAAELMQVTDPVWRGAAERLLASFGKNLLVPEDFADRVAAWVNARRLVDSQGRGVDLFYERVPYALPRPQGSVGEHSILKRIQVKDHPLQQWLQAELLKRFNYTCVDSPEELRHHSFALTKEGLIRAQSRHQKRDRRRIDDRSHWILGWSNHDRVDELRSRLSRATKELDQCRNTLERMKHHMSMLGESRRKISRALEFQWEQLDEESKIRRAEELSSQLALLTGEDSDLSALEKRRAELSAQKKRKLIDFKSVSERLGAVKKRLEDAAVARVAAEELLAGVSVDLTDVQELDRVCRGSYRSVTSRPVDEAIAEGRRSLQSQQAEASGVVEKMARQSMSIQLRYISDWSEYATNLTESEQDIPDFLALLERLEENNLPSFEERFRELLREQTQKEIASLSMEINGYYRRVKRRIDPVNESLSQTPYNQERQTFLRIEPRHAKTVATQEFLAELKEITEGQLSQADESPANAELRFSRIERLMYRLSSQDRDMVHWRQEVLDTRRHVAFIAHEENREGTYRDVYDTSAGRSGGQSQKLVTFALAAALRFQLADPGKRMPRYGTIMLDEAFDKTDAQYARASLEIFRSFGFQLVLASPMKMNQTVEPYVGGVLQTRLDLQNRTRLAFAQYDEAPAAQVASDGV